MKEEIWLGELCVLNAGYGVLDFIYHRMRGHAGFSAENYHD